MQYPISFALGYSTREGTKDTYTATTDTAIQNVPSHLNGAPEHQEKNLGRRLPNELQQGVSVKELKQTHTGL